ncbi:MAG: SDR family NAD(P)-dependent oxidoreductase, partial [Hyphomicrobiales bacterium]
MKIENAITFVTGGNRGIGRALVQELLDAGAAKVYAGMRDPAAYALHANDARVVPVQLDVTIP